MVPYVDSVIIVTMIHILLFVLHVCILREYEGAKFMAMLVGVVVVSAGHINGTHGSRIVSSAADVLGMSVVRGMRGVCEMCMCLARCGVGGEGVSG